MPEQVSVYINDCLDVLRTLPPSSVDAVVTDPPYELGFMGRAWDRQGIAYRVDMWAECLRVLKPGGHLLAFGGTRTWHRLACAVEDAGFEVRDSIAWLYGQGFAKSWNFNTQFRGEWCRCNPLPYSHAGNAHLSRVREDIHPSAVARGEGQDAVLFPPVQRGGEGPGVGEARPQGPCGMVAGDGRASGRVDARGEEPRVDGRQLHRRQGLPASSDAGAPERPAERLRVGARPGDESDAGPGAGISGGSASRQPGPGGQPAGEPEAVPGSHEPLDDGALRDGPVCSRCGGLAPFYRGAGTALKPAFEPIIVARKPLQGTVAANVLAHGTGGLNIDGCRIATPDGQPPWSYPSGAGGHAFKFSDVPNQHGPKEGVPAGRWPSNVVLDPATAAILDEQSGYQRTGTTSPRANGFRTKYVGGERTGDGFAAPPYEQGGGASRFFPTFRYEAKASTKERPKVDGVAHPTVKPLKLMRWLVRLVTPPGGMVLDPFAGSGTTAEACILEGFGCIAIESEPSYLPLIQARLARNTPVF